MADLTISNLKVGENESGLVHYAEATVSDGKTSKLCHVEFIDMPLTDGKGALRMDAVGSMLMAAYTAPEFVNPPQEEGGEFDVPEEVEPPEFTAEYVAERKIKLTVLKAEAAKLPKTIVVKAAAVDIAEVGIEGVDINGRTWDGEERRGD
jgi:hypothetical protein